jgi:peptidoglycan/xylan/chitin deacetylase (PgdA/CDA1 family)
MATNVLLTIDTELRWAGEVAAGAWQETFARSYDPAGFGIPYQLAKLAEHGLRAVFFVDPMPAAWFGIEPIKRMIAPILDAGQSVELHLHPQWANLRDGAPHGSFELIDYDEDRQRALLEQGRALLVEAGAPQPIAFRAGSYSANDATLRAAAALGLRYDSSHNGMEHPWPSAISLPVTAIAPVAHQGMVEIPVTVIADRAGPRHFQICALSLAEMRAALVHAVAGAHPVVTIVGHSFELATRNGRRVNRVHRRRFDALCAFLAEHRSTMPTRTFADLDGIPLGATASPLPDRRWRAMARQAEQLWSNLVEERRG